MMINTSVRLAARNTLRRRVRTALTAGMVMLGVALLMVGQTWIGGVMGGAIAHATAVSGHVRIVDPDFASRQELQPLEENLPEVQALAAQVRKAPGVVAAEPRIATGVTVTVGEELGDVFAQAVGAGDGYFRERLGLHQKLAAGSWFTGAPDELIAGAKVVELTGAKLGDELLLLGVTQDGSLSPIKGKLVGIVQPGASGADQQVLIPLEKAQWLTDIPGGATELLVYGARYTDAAALAASVRAVPAVESLTVQAWSEREPWRSLGQQLSSMQAIISLAIVFLAALGIWNTMMMSVLERTSEIGVLRALGLTRLGAVGLFVGEAVVIGVLGGLFGVGLGAVPSWMLERYGVRIGEKVASSASFGVSEVLHGDLNLEVVVVSFCLGLLMAVLGSLLPSLRAASIQPVTAMRSGR